MAHLIDKDALVAEIESLTDNSKYCDAYECGFRDGNNSVIDTLRGKLDTLDVKEVDLDKYINKYFKKWYVDLTDQGNILHSPDGQAGLMSVKKVARHFFELGLRKSK